MNQLIKNVYIQKSKQHNFDPNKFETDIKYFCQWFNLKSEQQRNKLEYFYGPYYEN